ncbi:MAG: response regulator transcription factor [Acidobacteria bacterium]|nr:response regulator transcription factor [Acidobacteriota bacterium]
MPATSPKTIVPDTAARKIRVILADDHAVVRQGFRRILEESPALEVVGEAGSGADAVRLALEKQPDVAVLDLTMPGGISGIEAARQITAKAPQVRILILSMHADEAYLAEAFEAGARGYLLKDSIDFELVQAVQAVYKGSSFLSSTLTTNVLEDYLEYSRTKRSRNRLSVLTDREREVLCLVDEGKSNKEISQVLNLSQNTVETHRARCMEKLGLHNTAEMVLYAVRKGLVC